MGQEKSLFQTTPEYEMCNVFEFANAILVKSDTQIFSQLYAITCIGSFNHVRNFKLGS
jgi:hypothetical protein